MDAVQHWTEIREIVDRALRTAQFCAVGTVGPDGSPHIAPIGSLFLLEPGKGFYLEKFPKTTRANLEHNQRLCILAAPRGLWSFIKALFTGRFERVPAVRLFGRAGVRRPATEEELRMWEDRIRRFGLFRNLKGYKLLWENMEHVREITIETFEPVHFGAMTRNLFRDGL